MILRSILTVLVLFSICTAGTASDLGPVKPSMNQKCPVCGMMPAKHPKWVAEIVFNDGTYVFFDGPKDMFKYYLDISRYSKGRTKDEIAAMYVTDYYTTEMVRADDEVYYITGSDVKGPMGEELVPVKGRSAAETFMKDHGGAKMLRFDEVSPSDIPKGKMKMKGM